MAGVLWPMAAKRAWITSTALLSCLPTVLHGSPAAPQAPDLLSFAQGAVALRVEADAAAGVTIEQALRAIDGSPTLFSLTRVGSASASVALVYELPAMTVFERLAVPDVIETPSPRQTFVRDVAVWGSAASATDGFVKLASASLSRHKKRGEQTELTILRRDPVRWVRLELGHGLEVPDPATPVFLEFSEIIGEGRQESVPLSTGFAGGWQGRGMSLSLRQSGPVVSGCNDDGAGRLQGTVEGRLLRATGSHPKTGVPSAFVAALRDDGTLQVIRSSNGAPFYLFSGSAVAAASARCDEPARPALGCGSVIQGIRFDFDSATIRPESAAVLQSLHDGLARDKSARIDIEGHTSSEGDAAYNRKLSERRAQAVVDELVGRGLERGRLAASGVGEARPLAPNDDEIGRSLNRRVEIRCGA